MISTSVSEQKTTPKKLHQQPRRDFHGLREISGTLAVAVAAIVLLLVDAAFADVTGLARLSAATPDLLFLVVAVVGLCLVQVCFYAARRRRGKAPLCVVPKTVPPRPPFAPQGNAAASMGSVADSHEVDRLLRTLKASKPEVAEETFQRLLHLNTRDTVTALRSAVQHIAGAGFPDRAASWIEAARKVGITLEASTYTSILDAYHKAEDGERAEALTQHMREVGIMPDTAGYALLIRVLAKTGSVKAAETWLDTITESGIAPTSEMLTSVVLGYCKKSDPQNAEKWINEMMARGLDVSVTILSASIDAWTYTGNTEKAEAQLELLSVLETPSAVNFWRMIKAFSVNGDFPGSQVWYSKMVSAGRNLDVQSLSALVGIFARHGRVDAAEWWLQKMQDTGKVPDATTFASVIFAASKAGELAQALRTFEAMRAHGVGTNIATYSTLALAFAKKGDVEQVENLRLLLDVDQIPVNEYFICAQLEAYSACRPRLPQRAEKVFREGIGSGLTANWHMANRLGKVLGTRAVEVLQELGCGSWDLGSLSIDVSSATTTSKSSKDPIVSMPAPPTSKEMVGVTDVRHDGIVQTFNWQKGFGFIFCEELQKVFGEGVNVFVHTMQIGSFQLRDEVTFAVFLNKDGKPQAKDLMRKNIAEGDKKSTTTFVRPAPPSSMEVPGVTDRRFVGVIRVFNRERGFGFIHSPELVDRFQERVFLHQLQIGPFDVGDSVSFGIFLNKDGKPQAKSLERTDEVVHLASDSHCAVSAPVVAAGCIEDDDAA
jgi:pentatricopeptide repeat protein